MSDRQSKVYKQVSELYQNSEKFMARWLWQNHVQIVAQNALELAARHSANADYVYAGALLHDLADIWMERTDAGFEAMSRSEAEKILKKSGFDNSEIAMILGQVIEPHSCYPGNMPQTLEGKILATADAFAHINTTFYYDFKKMGYPKNVQPEDFKKWVQAKLERDYHLKIFCDEERKFAEANYLKLKKDFA